MRIILLIIALMNILCLSVEAQTYDVFNSSNGFVDDYISSLYVDSNGTLWIGTYNNGIYTYANDEFTHYDEDEYDLLTGRAKAFAEDSEGNLWIGFYHTSQGGVMMYDGEEFVSKYSTSDSISIGRVLDIQIDTSANNELIIYEGVNYNNKRRLNIIRNDSLLNYEFGNLSGIGSTTHEKEGNVLKTLSGDYWITHGTKGLYKLEGDTLIRKTKPNDGGIFNENQLHANNILQDDDGNLWIGVMDRGLIYSPENVDHRWYWYTMKGNIWFNMINNILPAAQARYFNKGPNGHIWFSTLDYYPWMDTGAGSLYLNTFYDGNLISLELEDESLNEFVGVITSDAEDNVWVGLDSSLLRVSNIPFEEYDEPIDTMLVIDTLNINIDTTSIEGATITYYNETNGFVSEGQRAIFIDQEGMLWAAIENEIYTYSEDTFKLFRFYSNGLYDKNNLEGIIYDFDEDSQGNIWITMDSQGYLRGGIYKYDGENIHIEYVYENGDLLTPEPRVVFVDTLNNNELWVGYYDISEEDSGLQIFKEDTVINYASPFTDTPDLYRIKDIKRVNSESVAIVNENLPLCELNNDGEFYQHALPSEVNYIQNVAIGGEHDLWLSGNKLSYYNGNEWNYYSNYLSAPESANHVYIDSEEATWVVTSDQLYRRQDNMWNEIYSFPNISGGKKIIEDHEKNLWITDPNGLIKISNLIDPIVIEPEPEDTTDVHNLSLKNNFIKCYPNPTYDELIIELKYAQKADYMISDINGNLLQSGQLNRPKNRINVAHLNAGVYNLAIVRDKDLINQKIVILD